MSDEQKSDETPPATAPEPAAPPAANWREDAKQEDAPEEEVRTVEPSNFAPLVGEYRVGRLNFLVRRAPARPWTAMVFVRKNGAMTTFRGGKQPTVRKMLWGGFRSQYEVDVSLRRLTLGVTLPSAGDAFVFRAAVDVQWRVVDPELVVRSGITDVRRVLVPQLLEGLRQETRSLQIGAVESAEKAAAARFESAWLEAEHGLWTKVLVRLRMDKQTEHNLRLTSEVQAFKTLIEGGDIDQFALQLAQNPQQVAQVVEALVKERDTHRREVFDFVNNLLASDALDRWQIDDQVRVTLEWLKVSINRVISGTDEARQLSFGSTPPAPAGGRENGVTSEA
ncbi:hypothetical protein [Amycolatopsis sp. MtRt-6]|uniref:hypothetical protein n=1 Tax=Amycolatopsis sp. MtRt-6 TaxID=2792782 RepID=UPI001A90B0C3|nr:hypothetical protein [Amycolatopsis sp. MtRt-6]